jgi:hypothetical protein
MGEPMCYPQTLILGLHVGSPPPNVCSELARSEAHGKLTSCGAPDLARCHMGSTCEALQLSRGPLAVCCEPLHNQSHLIN